MEKNLNKQGNNQANELNEEDLKKVNGGFLIPDYETPNDRSTPPQAPKLR